MSVLAPRLAERGARLLHDPLTNKGTAFTEAERRAFGLDGLLPSAIESLEQQVLRAMEAFQAQPDDLARHIYLRALQDTNEVLFYKLVVGNPQEMFPIVYTPTVGLACQRFSHIYRRSRGLFLSYPHRDRLEELLRSRPHAEVDVVVVTDGERILGLGDQGAGGLGIPIGKLSLYTAVGGIHPARTLPIVLDVGTNNAERLADPEYLGWRHERITGQEYDDFIEGFVSAVEHELPGVLLQWEDFSKAHARRILDRYRDRLLSFNDDIQGTAAVTTGALSCAVRASGSRLRDQRVVVMGAGSAAIGVADMLRAQMVADGLPEDEARRRFFMVNRGGLLISGRQDLSDEQRVYAQPVPIASSWTRHETGPLGLADVVANTRPTVLIGLSTMAGAFSEPIVREMARHVERPIIFPLSNPTSSSEADPADLFRWTDGRAFVATGSPFPPVNVGGALVPVAQCNNVFVFPALGLGVVASRATRVTDNMLGAAAAALCATSPAGSSRMSPLLPGVERLQQVALDVAVAVAEAAVSDGVAPAVSTATMRARVEACRWDPQYSMTTLEEESVTTGT
jgi:malate dehydrogenase (oxaloacetate-decarboxylating)